MTLRVKKPHFIPEKSYLDHFAVTENGKFGIWSYFDVQAFLKKPEESNPQLISPEVLCKEHGLYESPIFPVNTIENMLTSIENSYRQILKEKIIPKKDLTEEEQKVVAYFISTLEARTPTNRAMYEQFTDDVLEKVRAIERQHMDGRQSSLHKEMIDERDQNNLLTQSIAIAANVNRWQFARFQFLHIGKIEVDQFFITSDYPTALVDFASMNSIYGISPLSPTLEFTVPLTSQIALFANNIGLTGHVEASPNYVREINNRTVRHARKMILSPRKITKDFVAGVTKRYSQSLILNSLRDELLQRSKDIS